MTTTKLTGTIIRSGSIPVTALAAGVISGLVQPGTISSSNQVDYNSITNKLSGVVSSSTQVQPLLPGGTVSASSQVDITSITNYSTFSSSIATKNDLQDISIGALNAATSSYAINSTIQSQLAGVVSSSTQVTPLLPADTVSSSTQYPGWVTASSQIDYNNITNKLLDVVSASAQVQPLLPGGTVSSSVQTPIRTFTVTNSGAGAYVIDGVNNDTLTLIRGFTYNFSVNASGHPFWIQTVAGAYSSGNIYSTGITNGGAAVGTISFTVPYNAPNTLYYVCQFHSSMAGVINIKDIQPFAISGASVQTSGNGTIGGNLTVATNTLFVTSSGNVGIGTTTPSASLHVSGTMMIQGVIERVNITGSAPPTTLNVDAMSGSVFYLSGSSANNWTINFRGSAATSLNTMMYDGQSITFAVLVNHSSVGYTASTHQVDGASITPRWQGGTLPSGSGTSTDIYSYTVIKRSSAVFNIFASQTKFA